MQTDPGADIETIILSRLATIPVKQRPHSLRTFPKRIDALPVQWYNPEVHSFDRISSRRVAMPNHQNGFPRRDVTTSFYRHSSPKARDGASYWYTAGFCPARPGIPMWITGLNLPTLPKL
jgi:hypothetical protein